MHISTLDNAICYKNRLKSYQNLLRMVMVGTNFNLAYDNKLRSDFYIDEFNRNIIKQLLEHEITKAKNSLRALGVTGF